MENVKFKICTHLWNEMIKRVDDEISEKIWIKADIYLEVPVWGRVHLTVKENIK